MCKSFAVLCLCLQTLFGTTSGEPLTVITFEVISTSFDTLKFFLNTLQDLAYPKKDTVFYLFLRKDEDSQQILKILESWTANISGVYHDVIIKQVESSQENDDEKIVEPKEFTFTKAETIHLMKSNQEVLDYARELNIKFIFYLTTSDIIVNKNIIEILQQTYLDIASPAMLYPSLVSNFWPILPPNTSDETELRITRAIQNREEPGLHKVRCILKPYLISLRSDKSTAMTFGDWTNLTKPYYDIFHSEGCLLRAAYWAGLRLAASNQKLFGYHLETDIVFNSEQEIGEYIALELLRNGPNPDISIEDFVSAQRNRLNADGIYVINLEQRYKRRIRMETLFKVLGLKNSVFVAIDGRKEVTEEYVSENNITLHSTFIHPNGYPLTPGQVGCAMSHLSVWKDMLDRNINFAVIFEDDAAFEPAFIRRFNEMIKEANQIRPNWDLIFLTALSFEEELNDIIKLLPNATYLAQGTYSYSALAYVLSKSGARKLVSGGLNERMLPADIYISIMADMFKNKTVAEEFANRNLELYNVKPMLINSQYYAGEIQLFSDTANLGFDRHYEK